MRFRSILFDFRLSVGRSRMLPSKNYRRRHRIPDHCFKFIEKLINIVLNDTHKHNLTNNIYLNNDNVNVHLCCFTLTVKH